ncbi:OsmC family peroxiredoxin [Pseudomaricurvus alkylphenolicus]|uniref:OsmC family protein n=1 Tax=Pseudomaricurvus alkylphenolicus TaxID=1306991 RepID=UPI00141E1997|nr:OsmC family protein [Pseudomaricurvus alkylphenolicus]NIB42883.1 OsmC family peroxiredoxin [Pseudomaricurvus alkylphenolicus]
MEPMPHHYQVSFSATPESGPIGGTGDLPKIELAPPVQFDGPGNQWSPEELLMASLSSCLILSFKAIARTSSLAWVNIECRTRGTLDRVDGLNRFTEILSEVVLTIPDTAQPEKARRLVEKAEQTCFIANSLNGDKRLSCELHVLNAL